MERSCRRLVAHVRWSPLAPPAVCMQQPLPASHATSRPARTQQLTPLFLSPRITRSRRPLPSRAALPRAPVRPAPSPRTPSGGASGGSRARSPRRCTCQVSGWCGLVRRVQAARKNVGCTNCVSAGTSTGAVRRRRRPRTRRWRRRSCSGASASTAPANAHADVERTTATGVSGSHKGLVDRRSALAHSTKHCAKCGTGKAARLGPAHAGPAADLPGVVRSPPSEVKPAVPGCAPVHQPFQHSLRASPHTLAQRFRCTRRRREGGPGRAAAPRHWNQPRGSCSMIHPLSSHARWSCPHFTPYLFVGRLYLRELYMLCDGGSRPQRWGHFCAFLSTGPRHNRAGVTGKKDFPGARRARFREALEPGLRELLVVDLHAPWVADTRLAPPRVEVAPAPRSGADHLLGREPRAELLRESSSSAGRQRGQRRE